MSAAGGAGAPGTFEKGTAAHNVITVGTISPKTGKLFNLPTTYPHTAI